MAALDGDPGPYRIARPPLGRARGADRRPLPLRSAALRIRSYLHTEGTLYEGWLTLGAHLVVSDGVAGVRFAVWAPNAETVSLAGEFNDWDTRRHPMRRRNGGVWEIFIPGLGEGASYKYNVRSRFAGYQQLKADPYAFYCEMPPKSASRRVGQLDNTSGRTRRG